MKKLMNKIRKANKGFTLVELIIVIAIIAILSAVAAPQYIKYVDKSRWSQDQENAQILLTAVQVAVADPEVTVSETSVTFTSAGISVEPVAASGSVDTLAEYLYDAGWTKKADPVVTNKSVGKTTFTVTIAGNSVTGAWSGAHS